MNWETWSDIMAAKIFTYQPLRLFCGGYVKDSVYRTPVRDIETLQPQIINVLATVNEEMLENTWRKIEHRLDILRATNEAYVAKSMNSWQT